ncbi:uncharacterized protein V1516DRAFT_680386 [Lipomyces oligophaga]|uniref:uncharacterized protein n=1 Tax=Lipomyces oligophaga TaxID=45792 RepID=UPI0034CEAAE2
MDLVDESTSDIGIRNSIIVPAYHEQANVRPVTERVFAALGQEAAFTELIFVDDNSKDGTVEAVQQLKQEGFNVDVIVRTTDRGLSSAVMRGFLDARGKYLVCMDADLQHPPERLPAFLHKLQNHGFVAGTRYGPGVEMDKHWPLHRRVISFGARMLAFPLTSVSDPMTGFFGIQKDLVMKTKNVNSQGFKIALDLLVKSDIEPSQVSEVPYSFGIRTVGESKLTGKVMLYYLKQLEELYIYKFGLVPLAATIISIGILVVLVLSWIYTVLT